MHFSSEIDCFYMSILKLTVQYWHNHYMIWCLTEYLEYQVQITHCRKSLQNRNSFISWKTIIIFNYNIINADISLYEQYIPTPINRGVSFFLTYIYMKRATHFQFLVFHNFFISFIDSSLKLPVKKVSNDFFILLIIFLFRHEK